MEDGGVAFVNQNPKWANETYHIHLSLLLCWLGLNVIGKKIPLTKVNLLSYALRIKSILENLIKMLADPSRPTLLTIHNDRSEFVQQLGYNYIAFYDYGKYYYGSVLESICQTAKLICELYVFRVVNWACNY